MGYTMTQAISSFYQSSMTRPFFIGLVKELYCNESTKNIDILGRRYKNQIETLSKQQIPELISTYFALLQIWNLSHASIVNAAVNDSDYITSKGDVLFSLPLLFCQDAARYYHMIIIKIVTFLFHPEPRPCSSISAGSIDFCMGVRIYVYNLPCLLCGHLPNREDLKTKLTRWTTLVPCWHCKRPYCTSIHILDSLLKTKQRLEKDLLDRISLLKRSVLLKERLNPDCLARIFYCLLDTYQYSDTEGPERHLFKITEGSF